MLPRKGGASAKKVGEGSLEKKNVIIRDDCIKLKAAVGKIMSGPNLK